jgi:uncharacterized protein
MLCPICKKTTTRREDPSAPNPFFPFCSDRCRLVDLGRWLDGRYQIPAEPTSEEDVKQDQPRDPNRRPD